MLKTKEFIPMKQRLATVKMRRIWRRSFFGMATDILVESLGSSHGSTKESVIDIRPSLTRITTEATAIAHFAWLLMLFD